VDLIPERIQFKLTPRSTRQRPHTTSDRSLGCPTFKVGHHYVLHHLIIYSPRQFVAKAFPVSGPALWNSLPPDITPIGSPPVFRRCLSHGLLFLHSCNPGAVKKCIFSLSSPRRFLLHFFTMISFEIIIKLLLLGKWVIVSRLFNLLIV